ncbi:MAG: DUF1800 domain-containing protein [Chloroflexi bacterium]|nr:MAG: DUF1800 domain-containing protein [Chloroflexota bacterium]TMC34225.1 MAG: DUF1800 domain-containing protein [Chloroflexota bacterium]TME36410.1 MAG: DUF1800 domain-containing protein [Chloroflexota bacterium]
MSDEQETPVSLQPDPAPEAVDTAVPSAAAPTTAHRKKPKSSLLRRRDVLAAATAAGVGVAAARLVAWANEPPFTPVPVTGTQGNKTGLDWVSPLNTESARVAHLLRRTTFGATQAELEKAQSDGYAKTIDRLIETPIAEPAPFTGGDDASQDKPLNIGQLQQWWIEHMLSTPTPFGERMTLFWHGHFTSDFRKVSPQNPFIYWQNQTWRKFALSDLRTMLYQVTIDPGMLRYLDLATSTGRNPNENYSRELMELFSMGADAFTEDDVKAAAKGLAGWREPLTQAIVDAQLKRAMERGNTPKVPPKADSVKTGVFERQRAYAGAPYAFLGETKVWNTDLVLDKIVAQDATAPFITRRVVTHFAMPTPDDAYIARLAASFRKTKYDVKTLMRDVFMSPEFTATSSYRALVKTPIEYMVHAVKALGDPSIVRAVMGNQMGMGQTLFDPPSVGGWPQNESWISSNTMLARANFATQIVTAAKKVASAANAHQTHLDGVLSAQTLKLLNEATDDRKRWMLVFASPEFQLK